MLKVIAQQEHYLLVSNGQRFTVVERRAGKYYPLHNGARQPVELNVDTVGDLLCQSVWYSVRDALGLLGDVAAQWRDLLEHVR
jgi:hypothetical protein